MLNPTRKSAKKPDILVIPYKDCLAKTVRLKSGNKPGISVETHCRIVGYVARELLNRLPIWLRESLFPKGSELIAAAHDVGKVSPGFQEKIHREIGDVLGIVDRELDKMIGYHYSVSQAAVNQCSKYIPEIIGRHHGYTPRGINSPDAEVYGGYGWQKQRMELLDALKKDLNTNWPVIPTALHSDVIAGLTTVADWIGSGSLFSIVNKNRMSVQESLKDVIPEAVDRAGFVTLKVRKGLTFKDIFNFNPRGVQMSSPREWGCLVLQRLVELRHFVKSQICSPKRYYVNCQVRGAVYTTI